MPEPGDGDVRDPAGRGRGGADRRRGAGSSSGCSDARGGPGVEGYRYFVRRVSRARPAAAATGASATSSRRLPAVPDPPGPVPAAAHPAESAAAARLELADAARARPARCGRVTWVQAEYDRADAARAHARPTRRCASRTPSCGASSERSTGSSRIADDGSADGQEPRDLIEWTGERCVPWAPDVQVVYEHMHRWLLSASRMVREQESSIWPAVKGFIRQPTWPGPPSRSRASRSMEGTINHSSLDYASSNDSSFSIRDAQDLSTFPDGMTRGGSSHSR